MKTNLTSEEIPLRATDISEFIRRNSCERRFKLGLNNRALTRELPYFNRFLNTIDPVLQKEGHRRENEWAKMLSIQGLIDKTGEILKSKKQKSKKAKLVLGTHWSSVIKDVSTATVGQPMFWREVQLMGKVGAFNIKGNLDFLLLTWSSDNKPLIHVVECKSSRRDKTYHRAQVVTYQLLLETISRKEPLLYKGKQLAPINFLYRVARIDEDTNQNQDIISLPPLDLSLERADIELLLAIGGPLEAIKNAKLNSLPYQLNQKYDGCTFSPHCFPESARYRRLELLGIAPSVCRVLQHHSVESIDDLAKLDINSSVATSIRNSLGFNSDLNRLRDEALTRISTLPKGIKDPDTFAVSGLKNSGSSQLPSHIIEGIPLVRVYLCIEYDYVENRIGALSAHVTTSPNKLHTPYNQQEGRPAPEIVELVATGTLDANGKEIFSSRPVQGVDIKQVISSAWLGNYAIDSGTERQLIQSFFTSIVDAIASVAAPHSKAPIHFYIWSRQEMKLLIEACTRVDSRLLSHLRELLGSRQTLEQLIYSSLRDEVNQRFALGWTGRGLGVITSLTWFGKRYHWTRTINGQYVELDNAFTQDIFDFKTELEYDPNSTDYWLDRDAPNYNLVEKHKFEIRSRFNDGLPAPYWRAYWRDLPMSSDMNSRARNAAKYYNQAAKPNFLGEYLRARTHALRWLDERENYKNTGIKKILLNVSELADFSLNIANAAQAGIDFLRLDHQVKINDWLIDSIQPTSARVNSGRTLPLANIRVEENGKTLSAFVDPSPFGLTLEALQVRTRYGAGDFVRLSPCEDDPQRGQTIYQLLYEGSTCVIQSIDWETGEVLLEANFAASSMYTLRSNDAKYYSGGGIKYATLDESVTDFIAQKVENRLRNRMYDYIFNWFDPERPNTPPQSSLLESTRSALEKLTVDFEDPDGYRLKKDQSDAILTGLATRIHLLQGPPGTGKTTTTATAILTRIAARYPKGSILLISANTHTAVDTLLKRIGYIQQDFRAQAALKGISVPAINLVKVHSNEQSTDSIIGVADWVKSYATNLKKSLANSVTIIGGTTNALLKMAVNLDSKSTIVRGQHGFQVDELIVDEASMMVFPHFLALATLVRETGSIMLTGDHRQLPPIVAHDWENEDRPPTVYYQPFLSAYDAIRRLLAHPSIKADKTRMSYSPLTFSFRLPPVIRELIKKLYHLDALALTGLSKPEYRRLDSRGTQEGWSSVWANQTGLYLVLHKERLSGQSNETEAEIIRQILLAAPTQPAASVAVIAPHRAQRTLLKTRLEEFQRPPYGMLDLVDTVNRLQGAERPTIIVSAAMSDPSDIAANAEFILELNRANVAFSRAKERLIVVCSESLLNHIPVEAEEYQDTLLWKSLRQLCNTLVASEIVDKIPVQVFTPTFDSIPTPS